MPAPAPAPISAIAETPMNSNFLNLPFFLGSSSTLSLVMMGPFLIRRSGRGGRPTGLRNGARRVRGRFRYDAWGGRRQTGHDIDWSCPALGVRVLRRYGGFRR